MKKILIKNCNLISMNENSKRYEENIDILINENTIERIEKDIVLESMENVELEIIDAEGKVALPGFINTHAHMPMSLFRETSDEYKLQEWLEKVAWPTEAKMVEEDIYYLSLLSCMEMIKTGTTTVNDHYFMTKNIIMASIVAGMNMVATRVLMDEDKNGVERIRELEELIEEYRGSESVKISVGIHGLYTSSEEYVKKGVELATKNNLLLHMHFCENSKEVEDIKKRYKVRFPAHVLAKHFSSNKMLLAHCVKLEKEDIDIMKKLDISVSHCPISNLKLGCGIAKIKDMMDKNINISLGTDGQGSGSNLDMFEVMKFTALLQKGLKEDPSVISAYDVLKMATINGAKALGIANRGSIEIGKMADIILIDLEKDIVTRPVNDIFADIVYNAKGTNVTDTIINGKFIMKQRVLLELDEEKIYSKINAIKERILQK